MNKLSCPSFAGSKPIRADIFVEGHSQNGSSSVRSGIVNGQTEAVAPTGLNLFAGGVSTNMPRLRRWLLLGICILHSVFCLRVSGQTYSVDWFKVAGGGGTSTGGVYTVTGMFGQQDAGGPMQGGGYSVVGGYWSLYAVQTSSATGNAPVITSQPQGVIIPPGNPASFTVAVSGTPPLLYQWQKNGANLTDGGNISGSTNATLTLSTTTFNDGGSYSVTVENAYGSVNSSVAKLTLLLPAYSITDLGTLGGTISYALGINNSGQVVGYSCMAGNAVYQAFLYSGGTMTNLGTLGGNYSWANAINNNGQVVGWSYTGVIYPAPYYYYNNGYEYVAYQNIPQTHAFLYSGGTMTDLGVFGVSTADGSSVYGQSYAYGINDSGQIVGYANTSTGSYDSFLYSNGELDDLDTISGNQSFSAYGINNGGVVVGAANVGNVNGPVSLKNGIISYLGTLGGYGGFAQCINNKGQVTGYSYTAGNVANHGFLYSGGPLVDLGTLGGSWCYPQGINNSGQVVGYSVTASNFEHAFLYSGGAMFDLNNLANTNSIGAGFYFPIANGINDSGQIIANGSNGRAYLLTPIAPATYLAGNLRPELQPPAATGGNIQFNWNLLNTSPAVGYQVQYTTNLVSGPWLNLGGVQTTTSFTDTASSDKQRFYRVMLVQ